MQQPGASGRHGQYKDVGFSGSLYPKEGGNFSHRKLDLQFLIVLIKDFTWTGNPCFFFILDILLLAPPHLDLQSKTELHEQINSYVSGHLWGTLIMFQQYSLDNI